MNRRAILMAAVLVCLTGAVSGEAAPRNAGGSSQAVAKLQLMVRDISSERDALKAEQAGLKTEADKLRAELEKLRQEKAGADAAAGRLSGELAAQKNQNSAVSGRLDQATAKLREVVDKYNALSRAKNELGIEHANLQKVQTTTAAELAACSAKNAKLYDAARNIIANYQKRGVIDTLLESEPFFGIRNVETEGLLERYRDEIDKQKYRGNEVSGR